MYLESIYLNQIGVRTEPGAQENTAWSMGHWRAKASCTG